MFVVGFVLLLHCYPYPDIVGSGPVGSTNPANRRLRMEAWSALEDLYAEKKVAARFSMVVQCICRRKASVDVYWISRRPWCT